MFSFEHSTTINRPVAEVFDYTTDPTNIPHWRPDVREVRSSQPPLATGSSFSEFVVFLGTKEFGMVVREWVPNQRAVFENVTGPGVRPTQRLEFTPSVGGTRVDVHVDVVTSGPFRLMEPLLPGQLRKKWVGYLGNLKRILETTAP